MSLAKLKEEIQTLPFEEQEELEQFLAGIVQKHTEALLQSLPEIDQDVPLIPPETVVTFYGLHTCFDAAEALQDLLTEEPKK
jgi:hypothetical protein